MFVVIFFFYFLLTVGSLGLTSLLNSLILLEVLSWVFILLLQNFSLNYLVIQSYFLILSMLSIIFFPPLLVVSFFIKLGIPPFHIWFIRITSQMKKHVFSFIMTMHKLLPILLLSKFVFSVLSFSFIFILVVFVSYFLVSSSTLFFTLIFSSMVHNMWMLSSVFFSKGFVLFYWTIYSSLFVMLIMVLGTTKVKESFLLQNLSTTKCWVIMSGIPPFMMFWVKVFALVFLIEVVSFFMVLMLMLVSVLSLTSYYRAWHFGSLIESEFFQFSTLFSLGLFLSFWGLLSK